MRKLLTKTETLYTNLVKILNKNLKNSSEEAAKNMRNRSQNLIKPIKNLRKH